MTADPRLHDRLLGDPDLMERFGGRAQLQALLDVEAALAEAEAAAGVVPASCVAPVRAAADADLYDRTQIAEEAAVAGNAVIPVVRHLTARVAAADPAAARYVHWGATSQDILDTGLVLQFRAAVPAVAGHLRRAEKAAAGLARRHAGVAMAGRTWLQQATPITFGLKAAGWADALGRTRRAVEAALERALVLQFGGAAGTLAALGARGLVVTEALAARLDLRAAPAPWHAHRDRFEIAGDREALAAAFAAYDEAMAAANPEEFPAARGATLIEVGLAWVQEAENGYRTRNLLRAVETLEDAKRYFDVDAFPRERARLHKHIGDAYVLLSLTEAKRSSERARHQQQVVRWQNRAENAYKVARSFGYRPAQANIVPGNPRAAGAAAADDKTE